MRAHSVCTAALLASALAGAALAAGCAGARTAERPSVAATRPHVAVDSGLETCAGCHAQVTPAAAERWRDSKHGVAQVQCLACHGSTRDDFAARPPARACAACHAAQASTVAIGRCFECHPAHALRPDARYGSPHGPAQR